MDFLAFFFFLHVQTCLSILQLRPRKAANLVKVTHKKNIRVLDPAMLTSPQGNIGNSLEQKARRSLPGYPVFWLRLEKVSFRSSKALEFPIKGHLKQKQEGGQEGVDRPPVLGQSTFIPSGWGAGRHDLPQSGSTRVCVPCPSVFPAILYLPSILCFCFCCHQHTIIWSVRERRWRICRNKHHQMSWLCSQSFNKNAGRKKLQRWAPTPGSWVSIRVIKRGLCSIRANRQMLPWRAAPRIGGPARWHRGWTALQLGTCRPHGSLPSPLHSTFYHNKLSPLTVFIRFSALKTWAWDKYYPQQLSFGQLVTRIIHTLGRWAVGPGGPSSGIFYRGDRTSEPNKNSWGAFLQGSKPNKPSL